MLILGDKFSEANPHLSFVSNAKFNIKLEGNEKKSTELELINLTDVLSSEWSKVDKDFSFGEEKLNYLKERTTLIVSNLSLKQEDREVGFG